MRNDWIIDVLADLKAFAELNGMDATAAGLDDAALIAVAEMSSLQAHGPGMGKMMRLEHAGTVGNVTHLFAGRHHT